MKNRITAKEARKLSNCASKINIKEVLDNIYEEIEVDAKNRCKETHIDYINNVRNDDLTLVAWEQLSKIHQNAIRKHLAQSGFTTKIDEDNELEIKW